MALARRCGATRLAERAFEELQATGARPRKILRGGVDALTPSERRVAGMAAEGLPTRRSRRRCSSPCERWRPTCATPTRSSTCSRARSSRRLLLRRLGGVVALALLLDPPLLLQVGQHAVEVVRVPSAASSCRARRRRCPGFSVMSFTAWSARVPPRRRRRRRVPPPDPRGRPGRACGRPGRRSRSRSGAAPAEALCGAAPAALAPCQLCPRHVHLMSLLPALDGESNGHIHCNR